MRARTPLSVAALCILTLGPARAFGQANAESRNWYDAALQDAKRSFLKCDVEAMSDVANDYTGVNFDGGVTKGRAAELKANRDFCAANTFTAWDVTTDEFRSSGSIAWAAGTMTVTIKEKASGKTGTRRARYLATYSQSADKKWHQQYFMTAPITEKK